MRFMKTLTMAAAIAVSAIAGQAQAAKIFTLTGTITPDPSGYTAVPFYPPFPTGTYHSFSLGLVGRFSAPVTGEVLSYLDVAYMWLGKKGVEHDGYDITEGVGFLLNNSTSGSGTYRIPSTPKSWNLGPNNIGLSGWSALNSAGGFISFRDLSAPVTYQIDGFMATPEPATWALMILGFGGIGAAMRRRVKHAPALMAA